MSASTGLGLIAGTATAIAAIVSIARLPAAQDFISTQLGTDGKKYLWRILALLFALLNLKNLPFVWHFRVFRATFYQLYLQRRPQPPKHLFAPMITSSSNTLLDCDYNIHKSNSTYFADLDVARANFMACLIRVGLAKLNRGDRKGLPEEKSGAKENYMIALGAVSCFFRRQIPPLARFEIYTRLLSWDRKWVYCVSHVVKKGAIKPDSYVFQPGKKSKRRTEVKEDEEEDLTKYIYATSVARYCFKKGRLTINPEIVLERSELLPPRPEGVELPPRAEGAANDAAPTAAESRETEAVNGDLSNSTVVVNGVSESSDEATNHTNTNDDEWTWDDMEKERLRGLEIAKHFDALNAAQDELRAGVVLGEYGDVW